MKKVKIPKFVDEVISIASKNAPTVFTVLAVIGVGVTVVETVKATKKSEILIEEAEEDKDGEELTVKETIEVCWKEYIPVVLAAGATVGCVVGANAISLKRSAALLAAYKLSETSLKEYKETAKKVVGEETSEEIKERALQTRIDNNPPTKSNTFATGKGEVLFYDRSSGRYFRSSMNEVKKAENLFNRQIAFDMFGSLNDLYDYLGLEPNGIGDELGWSVSDGYLELDFSTQLAPNDEPCIVMDFKEYPHFNFSSM